MARAAHAGRESAVVTLKACVVCGLPSREARCAAHRRDPRRFERPLRGNAGVAQRRRILERDEWRCQRCGVELRRELGGPGAVPEVGHRLARSLGGSYDDANLQAECRPCNRRAGNR